MGSIFVKILNFFFMKKYNEKVRNETVSVEEKGQQ
jgi:hypothetical protein